MIVRVVVRSRLIVVELLSLDPRVTNAERS